MDIRFEERKENEEKKVHVVMVSYPSQGHINPLLQFAKHLLHEGFEVTMPIILTKSTSLHDLPLTIDNVSLLPYQGTDPETSYALAERRQASIRSHLIQLLTRHRDDGNPIACVVYDSIMPWALDIAKEFGVLGAAFFTQSCAVNAIYYNFHKGWLSDVSLKQSSISLDGLPILHPSDLPSFVYEQHKYPTILAFLSNQYVALKDAHWIFVNTFDSLEPKVRSQISTYSSIIVYSFIFQFCFGYIIKKIPKFEFLFSKTTMERIWHKISWT